MNSDGSVSLKENEPAKKLLSASTVKTIQSMLRSVIDNGNAGNAYSEALSLAGKTGTAQSGIYKNGAEVCRTWFAGFFPADNPEYTVVVLNEDGSSGNADCAPVFREICEFLINLK